MIVQPARPPSRCLRQPRDIADFTAAYDIEAQFNELIDSLRHHVQAAA
jgi:hypothetical protein